MNKFSTFSCFWSKFAIFDRVSRAVAAVEGADRFKTVTSGIGEEKPVLCGKFSQISLIMPIFVFFLPFSMGAEDCDVTAQAIPRL